MAAAFPIARFAPDDTSKIVLTGNPLRPEVEALWGAPYKPPQAGGPLRLLVFGGSQGARAFSEIVPAALTRLPHDLKMRLSVVQQCRPEDIETVRDDLCQCRNPRRAAAFFTDLPRRMAEAHLVIARSGAGTVAELMAIGRPAILVPLPACAGRQPDAQCRNPGRGRCRLACARRRDLTPGFTGPDADQRFSPIPPIWPHRAAAAHALAMPDAAGKLADHGRTACQRRAA